MPAGIVDVNRGNRMAVHFDIDRKAADALVRRLRTLGPKVERKVVRKALSKAATPIARAMRKLAPKGAGLDPRGNKRKHLKQAIGKSLVRGNTVQASIRIGPDYKIAPHAHLVEFGTKPRYRKTIRGAYSVPGKPTASQLSTGTMPAHPYLRPAFKQERKNANQIIVNELRAGIEREARS